MTRSRIDSPKAARTSHTAPKGCYVCGDLLIVSARAGFRVCVFCDLIAAREAGDEAIGFNQRYWRALVRMASA